MADRNKFEEMLEKLVNEDRKGAEELFHEIVVEKSRTIYENLLEDDMEDLDVKEASKDDEKDDEDDKEVDEASDNDDEETNEATDEDEKTDESKDEEVDEASKDEEVAEEIPTELTPEGDDDMGGDPADDMMADIEDDAEGEDKPEGDEEIEDRVVDLEDALDDLKSEFEAMMADKGEESDDGEEDSEAPMDDMDMGDEEKEDEAFEPASELSVDEVPAFEGTKSQAEQMREYVEKVAEPKGEDNKAKSPVAGKNDMGGTTANIAKGSAEEKGGTGASAPKEENAGNVNVPGGKASKSMSNAKGHGAEKKGAGETGADAKSIIGS